MVNRMAASDLLCNASGSAIKKPVMIRAIMAKAFNQW